MSRHTVREVSSLADVRDLVRLYAKVWPGSFGIVDLLGSDALCLLLREESDRKEGAEKESGEKESGELAGYCFVELDPARGFAELEDFAVDPEHRRRGLGALLLGEVQSRYEAVKLIADTSRPSLLRFYERAGFSVECVIENYYSIGRDGARMSWRRG